MIRYKFNTDILHSGCFLVCLCWLGACSDAPSLLPQMLPTGGDERANCLVCHDNNGRGGSFGDHDFDADQECTLCHLATSFQLVPHTNQSLTTAACTVCHGYPPQTGAHAKHVNLIEGDSMFYGSLKTEADYSDLPSTRYRFGCGHCHPIDPLQHRNQIKNSAGGDAQIELYDPLAQGIKSLSPFAKYTPGTQLMQDENGLHYTQGTCENVYCHSDGRANLPSQTPRYRTIRFDEALNGYDRCQACHDSPPRYASSETSPNGHFRQNAWSGDLPGGHVLSIHWNHGLDGTALDTVISCRMCHAATMTRNILPVPQLVSVSCLGSGCHSDSDPLLVNAEIADAVYHVNGVANVRFAQTLIETTLQAPNEPPAPFVRHGGIDRASMNNAAYNPTTQTCTNVACHLNQDAVWGRPFDSPFRCEACHVF